MEPDVIFMEPSTITTDYPLTREHHKKPNCAARDYPPHKKQAIENYHGKNVNGKTEENQILKDWLNLPVWSIGQAISDVEDLKTKHEKNYRLLLEHEDTLTQLLNENIEMRRELQELKLQLNNQNPLKTDLDKEINDFRALFGLPPLSEKFEKISFEDLEGLLNDLSQEGLDSVEVIRSIRE